MVSAPDISLVKSVSTNILCILMAYFCGMNWWERASFHPDRHGSGIDLVGDVVLLIELMRPFAGVMPVSLGESNGYDLSSMSRGKIAMPWQKKSDRILRHQSWQQVRSKRCSTRRPGSNCPSWPRRSADDGRQPQLGTRFPPPTFGSGLCAPASIILQWSNKMH
jgi:hypothetical protein